MCPGHSARARADEKASAPVGASGARAQFYSHRRNEWEGIDGGGDRFDLTGGGFFFGFIHVSSSGGFSRAVSVWGHGGGRGGVAAKFANLDSKNIEMAEEGEADFF